MEITCIETGIFEEMNNALSGIIRKIPENQKRQRLTECLDNQDVCSVLDVSPRKLLTPRQIRAIAYSRIDRKYTIERKTLSSSYNKNYKK